MSVSGEEFLEKLPLVNSAKFDQPFMINGVRLGGGKPVIIAGPCAVESEEQIFQTAKFIKSCGAQGLRGGVFKPRSSPYSFQGLGVDGLKFLAAAKAETGLFTVVEATSIAQIDLIAEYADVIQIGARNMQNFELLKAVGKIDKPVLLKRGIAATVQELLQAAEYILKEGNSHVILCERGIRTFETITRNTLDINAIPLLKSMTGLPVLADPSHGTGRSDLVTPVAQAALAAGADGLIIEVHPDPVRALSDGNQSLRFEDFQGLMQKISLKTEMGTASPAANDLNGYPDLESFCKMAQSGYHYIPVASELVADLETPVTAFIKLTDGYQRFLLESVERGEQVGRNSYIGWDPLMLIKTEGSRISVLSADGLKEEAAIEPMRQAVRAMDSLKVAPLPELGKFYGGVVGYLGYDYVRFIEKLTERKESEIGIPDMQWIIPRCLAVFDHVTHTIKLIILAKVGENSELSYIKAKNELAELMNRLNRPIELPRLETETSSVTFPERKFSMSREEYMEGVRQIKRYIQAGDAFQVVLSQRIEQEFTKDPFQFYRILRTINPSPYLFYLDFGDLQLSGSSPEVMVRLDGEDVVLKPIAGTRPRGETAEADRQLASELLTDEKECAEHVMLVDLGRNDLGRVCRYGSVVVEDLMNVEYYSHVMHIVSTIHGKLRPGVSGADLLRAVFPAGTLTGAPKVRAMEIIDELEPMCREFYGGAVGYMGFNGNLDTCITIRTVLFRGGRAYIHVGAGIVADSVPELEYEETMNKAGALLTALGMV